MLLAKRADSVKERVIVLVLFAFLLFLFFFFTFSEQKPFVFFQEKKWWHNTSQHRIIIATHHITLLCASHNLIFLITLTSAVFVYMCNILKIHSSPTKTTTINPTRSLHEKASSRFCLKDNTQQQQLLNTKETNKQSFFSSPLSSF